MTQLLAIDIAVEAIRHAFDPLQCVVELYDNRSRIRYQAFGDDNTAVVSVSGVHVSDVLNPAGLVAEIAGTRARLERHGVVLKPPISLP